MKITCQCGAVDNFDVKDKRGFVCDICNRLFDVDVNGTVIQSPLTNATVTLTGVIHEHGDSLINGRKL